MPVLVAFIVPPFGAEEGIQRCAVEIETKVSRAEEGYGRGQRPNWKSCRRLQILRRPRFGEMPAPPAPARDPLILWPPDDPRQRHQEARVRDPKETRSSSVSLTMAIECSCTKPLARQLHEDVAHLPRGWRAHADRISSERIAFAKTRPSTVTLSTA